MLGLRNSDQNYNKGTVVEDKIIEVTTHVMWGFTCFLRTLTIL